MSKEIQSARLAELEKQIRKTEKHVEAFVNAFREIRDGKLYERAGFTNFADYCAARWQKSVRAVQLALQLDDVRKDVASSSTVQKDKQTRALAEHASDDAIRKLAKVPPAKRVYVLKAAGKETGGKPTARAVEIAAARLSHKTLPQQAPRGGFKPGENLKPLAASDARDNSGAYSSTPALPGGIQRGQRPPPVATAAAPSSAILQIGKEPVTDSASAINRMRMIYEREKEWFNALPPRTPRAILDKLIEGMNE